MRTLSNTLLAELYGQQSSDPFLTLLTLDHTSFTSTIYLVNNTVDVVSRSNTYLAFPMRVAPPADDGRSDRRVSIELDNVSLELIAEFRTITDPIDATVEMVLASDPDTVEIEIGELKVGNIAYDAQRITAELYLDDFLSTELTSEKYTPTAYPGLFI